MDRPAAPSPLKRPRQIPIQLFQLALTVIRKASNFEHVKRMATLMQERLNIRVQSASIHEDEGQFCCWKAFAVAARCLTFPSFQIEHVPINQNVEICAQVWIDALKNSSGSDWQLGDLPKGAQRISPQGIHIKV